MSLVPQGESTPPGYECYAELAAAFRAQGSVDLEDLRRQRIVLLDTREAAVAAIRGLWERIGQQEILCWMRIGGLEHRKVHLSIELFAQKVMPELTDLESNVPAGIAARGSGFGA